MKRIVYIPLEPVKSLIPLLSKLIRERKSAVMIVHGTEKRLEISEMLWRSHKFIPHGLDTDQFADLQPVLISGRSHPRSTAIIIDGNENIDFAGDTLILWNKRPTSADLPFTVYIQQPDLSWVKKT